MIAYEKMPIFLVMLALIVAIPALPVGAQEANGFTFFTVSLIPRIFAGNGGPRTDSACSFNIIAGERANLFGFEIASAVNTETGTVSGLQIAGIANIVARDVTGLQASPGVNSVSGDLHGFQLAGLLNVASSVVGVQASPGVNRVRGRLSGLQFGLVNIAENVVGLQVGIVNIAGTVSGLSLGLVTVEEGGIAEITTMIEYGDSSSLRPGMGVKIGTKSMYSAFIASVPLDASLPWTIDAGWGVRARVGVIYVDTDLSWRSPQSMDCMQNLAGEIRGSVIFRTSVLRKNFPLFAGISSELLIEGVSPMENSEIASYTRVVPGFFAGARLSR